MDLDTIVENLPKLTFDEVEKYSQDCSKRIIFDYLDKGQSFSKNAEYFNKCERILAEYRNRLSHRVKSDSGIDLGHKLTDDLPSK